MYICECGKEFDKKQSFCAHQGRCRIHLGDDLYFRVRERDIKNLEKATKKCSELKLIRERKFIEEEHICEFCGNKITKKIGSGRFCSSRCSAYFGLKHIDGIKKLKIDYNTSETDKVVPIKCLYCGTETKNNKFCSINCSVLFKRREKIDLWLDNKKDFSGVIQTPDYIRNYLLEKSSFKCEKCGWNQINKMTGKVPLHIHHKNGISDDNRKENLEVLCPNCHSLTESFGMLNYGNGRSKRKNNNRKL